jgi:hypothetical protein
MAAKPRKSRRGGAREGAGRKPFLADARRVTVTLEQFEYDLAERLADESGTSFSSVVREAIRAYAEKRKR